MSDDVQGRCEYDRVQSKGMNFLRWRRCSRRAVVSEDGKCWCRQHAPSAIKKRREESEARSKERLRKESNVRMALMRARNERKKS